MMKRSRYGKEGKKMQQGNVKETKRNTLGRKREEKKRKISRSDMTKGWRAAEFMALSG